jgi:HK97 gp10 family phage protein
MIDVKLEIKGMQELQRKAEQTMRDLHGAPMLQAMRDATLIVTRGGKINAPVDTGRLRASITPEVRSAGADMLGVVGSNVVYAPYQELGTRPHFPPIAALQVWARRHGISAFLVARAISVRGTPAKHFLKNAFDEAKPRIYAIFDRALNKIANSK